MGLKLLRLNSKISRFELAFILSTYLSLVVRVKIVSPVNTDINTDTREQEKPKILQELKQKLSEDIIQHLTGSATADTPISILLNIKKTFRAINQTKLHIILQHPIR